MEDMTLAMDCIKNDILSDLELWDKKEDNNELPHITLTYAQSIDGSITAKRGCPTLLSGKASMTMTHMLRTLHDCILVGIGTIKSDNPSLNVRHVSGPSPKPVIIDPKLESPLTSKLFTAANCIRPILICVEPQDDDAKERYKLLDAAGATILICPPTFTNSDNSNYRISLRQALQQLYQRGYKSVMIEGGASIITTCLQESAQSHFIDRVIITIAPKFIGGLMSVQSLTATPPLLFPHIQNPRYIPFDMDLIISGRL